MWNRLTGRKYPGQPVIDDKWRVMKESTKEERHYFQSWLDRWVVRLGNYMSILFLVGVIISVYEVISRYLFTSPTAWVHETTILLVGLCLIYGGAYCLAKNEHIRITLVYESLPPRIRNVADYFNITVVIIYLGMLVTAAWLMARKAWFTPRGDLRLETSASAWNSPSPAILKGFLFLVIVLMTIQAVLHLIQLIRRSAR